MVSVLFSHFLPPLNPNHRPVCSSANPILPLVTSYVRFDQVHEPREWPCARRRYLGRILRVTVEISRMVLKAMHISIHSLFTSPASTETLPEHVARRIRAAGSGACLADGLCQGKVGVC